jgi:hypothetical protein
MTQSESRKRANTAWRRRTLDAGGRSVTVWLDAQLASKLDDLRLAGESQAACVKRLILEADD